MVVSYTRARKRKKRKNHLTVATFILSYKDGGQFIHGERGNGGSKNLLASILGIGVTVNAARVPTLGILAWDSNGEPAITDTTDTQCSPVRLYFTFCFSVNLYILIAIM